MKLSLKQKTGQWDRFDFWKGRYKNFIVKIIEGTDETFGNTVDHYWVSFQSKKYKKGFHSLWEQQKFKSIDEAKLYAIEWIDNFIKELN